MAQERKNYIHRMAEKGYGHPMTEPDTAKSMRLGDVGFFSSDNIWRTLWNVFDGPAFHGKRPKKPRPWDRSDPRFTPPPSSVLPRVVSVGCSVDESHATLAPDSEVDSEGFHLTFTGSGAALILPESATMSSFSDSSLPAIREKFVRDLPASLKYARVILQLSGLVETDLVFIYGVVQTSDWALASYTGGDPEAEANFSVHAPEIDVSAGLGVWGSWQNSNGVLAIAGPQRRSLVKERVDDQCIFVKRLSASPITVDKTQKRSLIVSLKSWAQDSRSNPERRLEVMTGAGPPDAYTQLRERLEGGRFRILGDIDFADEAVANESGIEWTSVLLIGGRQYGRGESKEIKDAQKEAVENTISLLKRRSDDPNIQLRNSKSPGTARIDTPSTPTRDDPLYKLLNRLCNTDENLQTRTRNDNIKYAVATDDDVAELLKDADSDDDFDEIIKQSASPVAIDGGIVVRRGKVLFDCDDEGSLSYYRVELLPKDRPFASGASCDVWRGVILEPNNGKVIMMVALKCLRIDRTESDKLLDELRLALGERIKVWKNLSHRNILPMLGTYRAKALHSRIDPRSLVLLSPLYNNGDLPSYLRSNPKADKLRLVKDVIKGLAYLHGHDIVHAGLNGASILIDDCGHAILGLTMEKTANISRTLARHTARECYRSDDKWPGSRYWATKSSDVWAFGMTALEIFSGKKPFYKFPSEAAVEVAVRKGQLPTLGEYPEVPIVCWPILESCWTADPANRPTAASLVERFKRAE